MENCSNSVSGRQPEHTSDFCILFKDKQTSKIGASLHTTGKDRIVVQKVIFLPLPFHALQRLLCELQCENILFTANISGLRILTF